MSFDKTCLRVFLILFLLITGGFTVFIYGERVLTPIAVCLLPTETAPAKYVRDSVLYEFRMDSQELLYHSEIAYAGHTKTLLTTTPLIPNATYTKAVAQSRMNMAATEAGLAPFKYEQPAEFVFNVRFVRAFPSLVVRELPNASLWRYYADGWMTRDFTSFLISVFFSALAAFFLYRHIRSSRQYRR